MTTMWEEGNPQSKILLLAQAPSFVEKKLNQPLVGPSGEVLNTCLHSAQLPRRGCYILNLWREVVRRSDPYKSRVEEYFTEEGDKLWDEKTGLTPLGWEKAAPTLEAIRASGANVIVPLGAQATMAALGRKIPIGKWRGSLLKGSDQVAGKTVIPTYHPAATIHGTYLWRYLIINDLEKAARHKEFPELRLPKRNHIIEPRFQDVMEYIERCHAAGRVATDLEVINHQVACFSLCHQINETLTVPLTRQHGDHYWSEDEEMAIWIAYSKLMGDPNVEKINQNLVGFDAVFLMYQMGIITRGFLGDTMIAYSIMYPEFKKGLDLITSIYTDEPYYKDEGKMWKGLGGSIEEFWTYCGKDAAVALESWIKLAEEMTETGYWPTYNMTARLAPIISYMSTRGWKADLDRLKVTLNNIRSEIDARYAELKEVAEWEFNPLSPKQCQQYFYGTKGIQPYLGAKGSITTDDKAMARIVRKYNLREAKLVQEIRGLEKLRGTYLEINFDKDGRLRCSWNPRGTWTGRLSSSQTVYDTGANMQNLHPEFREFLVADQEPL